MNPNELQVAINEQQNAPLQLAKHTRFYCAKDIAVGLASTMQPFATVEGLAALSFKIVDALIEEANRAP